MLPDGQDIDLPDPLAPQERRDDALPDVEGAGGESAAVHEHPSRARELDQNRVALSHVEKRDLEVRGAGGKRVEDEGQEEGGETRGRERSLRLEPGLGQEKEKEGEEGAAAAPKAAPGAAAPKAAAPGKEAK